MNDQEQVIPPQRAEPGAPTMVGAAGREWNFVKRMHSELGPLNNEKIPNDKFLEDPARMHRIPLTQALAGWTI